MPQATTHVRAPREEDRLAIRHRPESRPLMVQTWDKLLFMHWTMPEVDLRPLIPEALSIDTFDGSAWIAITPFTIPQIRPPHLPAVPFISSSHEINVRTYVHHDGVPGVWFFSLDAGNPLAVAGARLGFSLPYFRARMTLESDGDEIVFTSRRRHAGAPDAECSVHWTGGEALGEAQIGSLDFFLIERYCLYAARGDTLYRARIHHRPWTLRGASLRSFASSMIESHGLPTPQGEPLLHGQAEPIDVDVWPLEKLGPAGPAR